MGQFDIESCEIRATIVYFGAQGAGTTSNLHYIQRKLRKEHRGELASEYADGNPEAPYESLQLQLGEVQGVQTSIRLHTVPTGPGQSEARRRLLAGVDGIVFVADLRPERHEATLQAFEELARHLASYGRSLDDLVLLLQHNRRDQADENALDLLHSKLERKPAATVEATAHDGTGVLQTLTSISRLVLADIRGRADSDGHSIEPVEPPPFRETTPTEDLATTAPEGPFSFEDPCPENSILEEAPPEEPNAENPQPELRIESAGPAEADGREIRWPIRLVEEGTDRRIDLCLRLHLDDG